MSSQIGNFKRIQDDPAFVPLYQGPGSPRPTVAREAGLPVINAARLEALAQKRLEQTSTSLEAALRAVEDELSQNSLDR